MLGHLLNTSMKHSFTVVTIFWAAVIICYITVFLNNIKLPNKYPPAISLKYQYNPFFHTMRGEFVLRRSLRLEGYVNRWKRNVKTLNSDPFDLKNLELAPLHVKSLEPNDKGGNKMYPYLGCYLDDYPRRDMTKRIFSPNLTNAICATNCGREGFPYSATQWGTECFCGMSYGKFGTPERPYTRTFSPIQITNKVSLSGTRIASGASACRMPCPGNWSEVCGGNNVNSIYYTDLPAHHRYLGCFMDKAVPAHDFPRTNLLERPFTMSVSMCHHHCLTLNFPYFAIKMGTFCFCGYNYGTHGLVEGNLITGPNSPQKSTLHYDGCDLVCPGNLTERCGSQSEFINAVYATDYSLNGSSISIYKVTSTWVLLNVKIGTSLNQSFMSQHIKLMPHYNLYGVRSNQSNRIVNNITTTHLLTFKVHYVKASSIIKSRHIKSKDLLRADFKIFTLNYNQSNSSTFFNLTSLLPKSTYKILIVLSFAVGTKLKQKFIGNAISITTCSDLVFITSVTAKNFTNLISTNEPNGLNITWTFLNNYTVWRESFFAVRYRFISYALCDGNDSFDGNNDLLLGELAEHNNERRLSGKVSTSTTQAQIFGLMPAAVYAIRVATQNDVCGRYFRVTTNSSLPITPILAFSVQRQSIKYSSVEFIWTLPQCNLINGPLLKIQIQGTFNDTEQEVVNMYECQTCSIYKITDLKPKTSYHFKVRYFNDVGPSPFSTAVHVTTPSKPRYAFYVTLFIILSFLVMMLLLVLRCLKKNQFLARKLGLSGKNFIKQNYKSSPFFRPKRNTNGSPDSTRTIKKYNRGNVYMKGSVRGHNEDDKIYKNVQKLFCDIPWQAIQVSEMVLGEGQFSQVRKATVLIKDQWIPVALKIMDQDMIKKDAFISELEIMGKVGFHENIVNLIGACIHEGVYFVALEYLEMGDLKTFLRKNRFLDKDDGCLKLYTVSEVQLINFSLDVAKGMAHLAVNNVIHRDLAARNILVSSGPNLMCKVGDFGLSREQNIYIQSTPSHLPWRWMSIESLSHRVYTTKSDVWSFGILLWEIVTLGGTPYWPLDIHDYKGLLKTLYTGYRMPQPRNCNTETYELMLECWEANPGARPSFIDIVRRVGRIKLTMEGIKSISRSITGSNSFKMTNWASGTYLNDSGVSSDQSLIGKRQHQTTNSRGGKLRPNRPYHDYEHMKFKSNTLHSVKADTHDKNFASVSSEGSDVSPNASYTRSKGKRSLNKRKIWESRASKILDHRYERRTPYRPSILKQESDLNSDKFLRLRKKLAACESIDLPNIGCGKNKIAQNSADIFAHEQNDLISSASFYDSLEYAEVLEAETIFDSLNRVIRETDIKKENSLIL